MRARMLRPVYLLQCTQVWVILSTHSCTTQEHACTGSEVHCHSPTVEAGSMLITSMYEYYWSIPCIVHVLYDIAILGLFYA